MLGEYGLPSVNLWYDSSLHRRLRSILCLAFAMAYVIPAQSRGDDVLCVEGSGKISFGCFEIVDFARYAAPQESSSIQAEMF